MYSIYHHRATLELSTEWTTYSATLGCAFFISYTVLSICYPCYSVISDKRNIGGLATPTWKYTQGLRQYVMLSVFISLSVLCDNILHHFQFYRWWAETAQGAKSRESGNRGVLFYIDIGLEFSIIGNVWFLHFGLWFILYAFASGSK